MDKIKENKIIDLRDKDEYDKRIELGKLSAEINKIFEKSKKNK